MNWIQKNGLYGAWIVALIGCTGSLYFQYGLHFPPCVLCWYQRIALYPLVIIIPVGIIRKDTGLAAYALPLTVIGGSIALYHNLLYYKIIPENLAPCVQGISCTTKFIEYFGFLTIPLLSLIAFIAITLLMMMARKGFIHDQGN